METKPNSLPSCSGYEFWTIWGDEFDCNSIHTQDCEYCLCNYHKTGGRWHPETGGELSEKKAIQLYGKPQFIGEEDETE
jgi:hypothetical protein